MKFQAEQQKLKHTLSRISGVIENRNTIPILAHVMIEVKDDYAVFTSTNLDIRLKVAFPVSGAQDGVTTVNAELLKALVDKLPAGELINFQLDGDLKVKSGKSNFKLKTLSAADFPDIDEQDYQSTLQFSAGELKNAIDKTVWAVSTEETRYYLNGIALQHLEGKVAFVSTDGHRLARYLSAESAAFPNIIIPSKTAKLVKQILDGGDAELEVSDNKVRVTSGDFTLTSKVIDATYPDWGRIVPKDLPNKFTANSQEVKSAIERVTVVSTERTKAVKLVIGEADVTFEVYDQMMGQAKETIDVDVDGPSLTIGLNSRYALDAMTQADKGAVTVQYGESMQPVLISYDKEPGLICVTMPMRVQ